MPVIGEIDPGDRRERRREVRDCLKAALRDMDVQMVEPGKYAAVGLEYTDRFASYIEVLSALSLLPYRQREILYRTLGENAQAQIDIALDLGISRKTVSREVCRGLDAMARRIFAKQAETGCEKVSQMSQMSHMG